MKSRVNNLGRPTVRSGRSETNIVIDVSITLQTTEAPRTFKKFKKVINEAALFYLGLGRVQESTVALVAFRTHCLTSTYVETIHTGPLTVYYY